MNEFTFTQMQEVLAKFSYRDGFEADILRVGLRGTLAFRAKVTRPCAKTGELIPLYAHIHCYERDVKSEEDVKGMVIIMIRNLELHEMDEYLKYEGVYINHPHPEEAA